jgi:hypothetical protein
VGIKLESAVGTKMMTAEHLYIVSLHKTLLRKEKSLANLRYFLKFKNVEAIFFLNSLVLYKSQF